MLSGELTLVTGTGEEIFRAGDCVAFPKNTPNGHHFINRSNTLATCLEIGTRSNNDVCYYPDIDLHIDTKSLLEQEKRIRSLPVPVVIDHIARVKPAEGLNQPAFQLLLDLLKLKHVWVKVSGADKICNTVIHSYFGLPFVEVIPYARAVISAAPDRVIWGTDWPHSNNFVPGHTPNDGDLVDLLAEFAPDRQTRERILVNNPATLYRFE